MSFNKRAVNLPKTKKVEQNLPRRHPRTTPLSSKRNISQGNCLEERVMLQSLSGLSLGQMLARLNGYLSNHKPCINIPAPNTRSSNRECACGDVNSDGDINVLDVVILVTLVLNGGYNPCGDVNNDGTISVLDIVAIVDNLLGGSQILECPTADDPCAFPNVCTGGVGTDENGNWVLNYGNCTCLPWEDCDDDIWYGPWPSDCTIPVWPEIGFTNCMYFCGNGGPCYTQTDPQCDPCEATVDWPDLICLDEGCGVLMDKCFQCGGDLWTCQGCCGQWTGTSQGECEARSCTEGQCQWNAWGGDICEGPGSRRGGVV